MIYSMLIWVFLVSVFIGSFLNVVILRMDKEETFFQGRSHCMDCGHTLGFWDLVPFFSFLFLRGKCRYCGASLSWQYPLVEGFTGVVFTSMVWSIFPDTEAIINWQWLDVFQLVTLLLLASQLIIIFVYDLKYMLIPVLSLRLTGLLGTLWFVVESFRGGELYSGLWTGLILSGFIFSLYFFSKKQGMGFGDVELMWWLGLFIPLSFAFVFFFGSFFIGSVWGLLIVAITRKKSLKVRMPFGPSIILAFWLTVVAMNFEEELIRVFPILEFI